MGAFDAGRVEHGERVRGQHRDGIIALRRVRGAMAARIHAQHVEVAHEKRRDRVPHRVIGAERVEEEERRLRGGHAEGLAPERQVPRDERPRGQERSEQEDPETQCVEARKRNVAGTDLERDQEVAEKARLERHDDEEDHRQAMHREHLIVEVRRQEVIVRHNELRANQHGLGSAQYSFSYFDTPSIPAQPATRDEQDEIRGMLDSLAKEKGSSS